MVILLLVQVILAELAEQMVIQLEQLELEALVVAEVVLNQVHLLVEQVVLEK